MEVAGRNGRVRVVLKLLATAGRRYLGLDVDCSCCLLVRASGTPALRVNRAEAVELAQDVVNVRRAACVVVAGTAQIAGHLVSGLDSGGERK